MKYKFQVMVALTYHDKDIEVEIDLSDDEVKTIKSLIAAYESKKEAFQKPAYFKYLSKATMNSSTSFGGTPSILVSSSRC